LPEKVPFRLTRVLVNAMEAFGIEGSFKDTCENVMRLLRNNKESLIAILEEFVTDPLITWRMLAEGTTANETT
jgi:FKBP12-rapamycin complex-associated protein